METENLKETLKKLWGEQLVILQAATRVLKESYDRVLVFKDTMTTDPLSVEQRETCEALTARYARLSDYLFQKAFRTIDRIELQDEGSALDRLNRMEKRGVVESASRWRELRELRNSIAHEYLIESSDRVLKEAIETTPELFETVERLENYSHSKGYH